MSIEAIEGKKSLMKNKLIFNSIHGWWHLAVALQPSGLLAVDVALHAGLSSADQLGVPQGQSAQRHRHRTAEPTGQSGTGEPLRNCPLAAGSGPGSVQSAGSPGQDPEEDDALMANALSGAQIWRRSLKGSLKTDRKYFRLTANTAPLRFQICYASSDLFLFKTFVHLFHVLTIIPSGFLTLYLSNK